MNFGFFVLNKSSISNKIKAISVFSMAKKVFFIRSCPNSLVSSKPAVSIKTTGPIPLSSIALKTKSVVVPAISETSA